MQFCAPDDGCGIYSKNVEQFAEINKQCKVATYWLYFGTAAGSHFQQTHTQMS